MTRPRDPSRPRSEAELVAATARHLEGNGYRVYVDPDGSNYFDLACRRGDEVGLVEAKLGNPTQLLNQALRRRAWADWIAVVVPSERTAATIVAASTGRRAEPVGVWYLGRGVVSVVRPARPFVPSAAADYPFAAARALFRTTLDRLDAGELPAGLRWDGLFGALRHASGGRKFAEWRLDEPEPDPD